ncbi:MAG: ferritin-like domain-containing protein [Gemmatimonadales bacterium]|nr:ferritin-like domain-containing protein [Gemmatimonadales bacterium]
MPLETMQDLLLHQLKDIYSAEQQLTKALPKLAEHADSEDLAQAFRDHLADTTRQVERLDRIFTKLDARPGNVVCQGMKGLIEEADELMEEDGSEAVVDAGLISAAQRVEHYEISAYGSAKAVAALLGHADIVKLLDESQAEETAADKKLSLIATTDVNARAAGTDPSMAARV